MAEILAFPTDQSVFTSDVAGSDHDRFLLDEGLELLGDFRSIEDRGIRDALRQLIKAMAFASRRIAAAAAD